MAVISSLLSAALAFYIGYVMAKEHYNPHIDYEKVIRDKDATIKELRGKIYDLEAERQKTKR